MLLVLVLSWELGNILLTNRLDHLVELTVLLAGSSLPVCRRCSNLPGSFLLHAYRWTAIHMLILEPFYLVVYWLALLRSTYIAVGFRALLWVLLLDVLLVIIDFAALSWHLRCSFLDYSWTTCSSFSKGILADWISFGIRAWQCVVSLCVNHSTCRVLLLLQSLLSESLLVSHDVVHDFFLFFLLNCGVQLLLVVIDEHLNINVLRDWRRHILVALCDESRHCTDGLARICRIASLGSLLLHMSLIVLARIDLILAVYCRCWVALRLRALLLFIYNWRLHWWDRLE